MLEREQEPHLGRYRVLSLCEGDKLGDLLFLGTGVWRHGGVRTRPACDKMRMRKRQAKEGGRVRRIGGEMGELKIGEGRNGR